MSPLSASVIICSRNRPEFLLEAVRSVLQGTAVPAELIVVDQSDAEHQMLRQLSGERGCELRYLWTRERGVSRARNAGLRAARQPIVASAMTYAIRIDASSQPRRNAYGDMRSVD